jgi:hypothetical protein
MFSKFKVNSCCRIIVSLGALIISALSQAQDIKLWNVRVPMIGRVFTVTNQDMLALGLKEIRVLPKLVATFEVNQDNFVQEEMVTRYECSDWCLESIPDGRVVISANGSEKKSIFAAVREYMMHLASKPIVGDALSVERLLESFRFDQALNEVFRMDAALGFVLFPDKRLLLVPTGTDNRYQHIAVIQFSLRLFGSLGVLCDHDLLGNLEKGMSS